MTARGCERMCRCTLPRALWWPPAAAHSKSSTASFSSPPAHGLMWVILVWGWHVHGGMVCAQRPSSNGPRHNQLAIQLGKEAVRDLVVTHAPEEVVGTASCLQRRMQSWDSLQLGVRQLPTTSDQWSAPNMMKKEAGSCQKSSRSVGICISTVAMRAYVHTVLSASSIILQRIG